MNRTAVKLVPEGLGPSGASECMIETRRVACPANLERRPGLRRCVGRFDAGPREPGHRPNIRGQHHLRCERRGDHGGHQCDHRAARRTASPTTSPSASPSRKAADWVAARRRSRACPIRQYRAAIQQSDDFRQRHIGAHVDCPSRRTIQSTGTRTSSSHGRLARGLGRSSFGHGGFHDHAEHRDHEPFADRAGQNPSFYDLQAVASTRSMNAWTLADRAPRCRP